MTAIHMLIVFAAGTATGAAAGRRWATTHAAHTVADLEDRAALADHFRGCAEWEAAAADHFHDLAEWAAAERDDAARQIGVLRRIVTEQARWAHILFPRQPRTIR